MSFALALGRFFSSKGCQIERFFFSSTSIKGQVAESAKNFAFLASQEDGLRVASSHTLRNRHGCDIYCLLMS